jgi:protein XagA
MACVELLTHTIASYDYEKLQLSAVYALTDIWSLQFGGYTTYAGRNALQENGVLLGVWRQF